MCWPGTHQQNCEERVKHSRKGSSIYSSSSDKLQCAIYYAIDGDQVKMIPLLSMESCILLIQCFYFKVIVHIDLFNNPFRRLIS